MVVKDEFLDSTSFQNGMYNTDSFHFITWRILNKNKGVENGYSYVEIKRKIKRRKNQVTFLYSRVWCVVL